MDDDDFTSEADFAALASLVERAPPPPPPRSTTTTTTTTTTATPKVVQPTPQALPNRNTPSALLVSPRQKGNPILTHIQSLPWEYTDTPADYVLGHTSCALFLSLKYHRLHPEYVYTRMRALGASYDLRLLLAMVDIDAHEEPLRELAKTSLVNNFTLVLAWSAREAARYLEAYKALEKAQPTLIKGVQSTGYADKMVEFVTTPRGVNKADAVGVVGAFGTVRAAVNAQADEVAMVQGWGEVKVKRWCKAVREPFRAEGAKRKEGRGVLGEGVKSIGAVRRADTTTAEVDGRGVVLSARVTENEARCEPDQDDEEALLAASAEAEREGALDAAGDTAVPPAPKRARYEEPKLGDGVASALAKFRQG